MRTSTGTVGRRLIAAALVALLLGACGRPAPADEAQSAAAPDPAAQSTTPSSDTVDAAVGSGQGDQTDAVAGATDEASGDAMGEGSDDTMAGAMDDAGGDASAGAEAEPVEATATAVTAPVLTPDQVVGVVDPTPGKAGVKITSQNPIVAPTPTTAPTTAVDPAPTGTGAVYVVQPGDTLSVIAENYGVSMQAIVDANGLVDPDNLTAGDELQIPPAG